MTRGIEERFLRELGPEALLDLQRVASSRPCILLSGGQLTGKSTVARHAGEALHGPAGSSGSVFRHRAEQMGLDIEELAAQHIAEPKLDVLLDYAAARTIMAGEVAVFECRLAGALGDLLRRLGRTALVSVHLVCQPAEAALRFIERRLGRDARDSLEKRVALAGSETFGEALGVLIREPEAAHLCKEARVAVERDERDRSRLAKLYGAFAWDLADRTIDTTHLAPEAVTIAVLAVTHTG